MSDREVYTAVCERDEESGWWVVTVAELPGVVTQARNLNEARRVAADAIALWLERRDDSFDVAVEARVGADADRAATAAAEARETADAAQAEASTSLREAVRLLVEEQGLSVRDAAQILGISYQRVAQLAPARTRSGA